MSCRFYIDNHCTILDLTTKEEKEHCGICTFYQTEEEHRKKEQYVKDYYNGVKNG